MRLQLPMSPKIQLCRTLKRNCRKESSFCNIHTTKHTYLDHSHPLQFSSPRYNFLHTNKPSRDRYTRLANFCLLQLLFPNRICFRNSRLSRLKWQDWTLHCQKHSEKKRLKNCCPYHRQVHRCRLCRCCRHWKKFLFATRFPFLRRMP